MAELSAILIAVAKSRLHSLTRPGQFSMTVNRLLNDSHPAGPQQNYSLFGKISRALVSLAIQLRELRTTKVRQEEHRCLVPWLQMTGENCRKRLEKSATRRILPTS